MRRLKKTIGVTLLLPPGPPPIGMAVRTLAAAALIGAGAGEVEDVLALEEEVALLGKQHAEPRQVDLASSSSTCAKSVL